MTKFAFSLFWILVSTVSLAASDRACWSFSGVYYELCREPWVTNEVAHACGRSPHAGGGNSYSRLCLENAECAQVVELCDARNNGNSAGFGNCIRSAVCRR